MQCLSLFSAVDQSLCASMLSVKRALRFSSLLVDNWNSKLSSTWTGRRRSQLGVQEGAWPAVVSVAGPMEMPLAVSLPCQQGCSLQPCLGLNNLPGTCSFLNSYDTEVYINEEVSVFNFVFCHKSHDAGQLSYQFIYGWKNTSLPACVLKSRRWM